MEWSQGLFARGGLAGQWLPFALYAIAATIVYILYQRRRHPLYRFPGPKLASWTSFYSAVIILTGKEHIYLEEAHRRYGPVVRWKPNTLLARDATMLPKIYHLRQTKSIHYNQSPSAVKGLVETRDWRDHKEKRKRLDKHFSSKNIMDDEPLIDTFIAQWIASLREKYANSGEVFDFATWGSYLMLDIVGKRFFGEDFGYSRHGFDTAGVLRAVRDRPQAVHFLARVPWLKKCFMAPPFSWFLLPRPGDGSGMGALMKVRDDLVTKRMMLNKPDLENIGLDQLLFGNNKSHSLDEVREDAMFLLGGASETFSHALRTFVINVSQNRDYLARLRSEISELASQMPSGQVPTYAQVSALPFLSACLRESMRHDPPVVSYLPRVVNTGGIELGGMPVPDGVEVACSPYVISRDSKIYGDDIEEFRPERFLENPEWADKVARYEFGFGYGPRRCIAQFLSQMVLAKALVQLFDNFDIEVLERGSAKAYLFWYVNGMHFRLKDRRGTGEAP